jgi:hypothetical protein
MHEKHNWHDAMAARLAQYAWTKSQSGQNFLQALYRHNVAEYLHFDNVVDLMRSMFATEEIRLMGSIPFFVSADMCTLVEAAMVGFQPEPIYPTDVLKLQGFMWYERPLTILDRFGRPMTIRAVSWNPARGDGAKPDRLLTRDDEVREYLGERLAEGHVDGLAITLYTDEFGGNVTTDGLKVVSKDEVGPWPDGVIRPPVLPFHLTAWWWGMSYEGNEVTIEGRPTGADWWWKAVQTTWRLMQQHISVRHYERPPRPLRREAKRMNVTGDDVVVVRLRRERSTHNGEPQYEINYTHRWIVEGHWRNQWYPSAQIHRQIYIADYEKGPEGAPLVVKPNRVYNFNR